MSEWIYNLPMTWMVIWVFGVTFFCTWVIYVVVMKLAVADRAKAFVSISGGMLPPLGVVYGLFVTIIASQVWGDVDKANTAVYREASALSTAVFLASSFPGEPEARIRALIRRHIREAMSQEWPMMAEHKATLKITSQPLAEALQLILTLTPHSEGQTAAQSAIVTALENALDARGQRIIVSQSDVNWVKWICLFLQAICTLLAIAMIHSGNRLASLNAMGIFAVGVAVSVLIIVSHIRPFGGAISVNADLLAQIEPEEMLSQKETNYTIALRLTTLLHAARQVISDNQELINKKAAGKPFTAETVIKSTLANYAQSTGHPLPDLDKHSAEGIMQQAELDAIAEVIDNAQPLINNPNVGFKGFLPAIFTYQVAQSFSKRVKNMAYLKLTAPKKLIRHHSNMPDTWEDRIIENKFYSPTWEKGGVFAEIAELNGKKAFRLMIPEYYESSCLVACHGTYISTKESIEKEVQASKIGDLGGAISAAIYLK